MHDVIRDMALWLARENGKKKNKFVVKDGVEPIRAQEVEKWKETQRISLWDTNIEELRKPPYFPNMDTFLASHKFIRMYSTIVGSDFTGDDEGRLLEELEQLEHIDDISIHLTSVSSIQTLLNSHKLQRSTRWVQLDVKINFEKEVVVYSKFPRHQCLNNLCDVDISGCGELLNLTWLICAPSLQFLSVSACKSMEKVIDDEKSEVLEIEVDHVGVFSRLISLTLIWLPKLRSIYGRALPFPSLRHIHVSGCPSLRKLPFHSNTGVSKKFEKIKGDQEWWDELEWRIKPLCTTSLHIFNPSDEHLLHSSHYK
ncbi:putative disease resistance protein [Vitis vinifera]|uniref:Putative disease resistance protein n=1 Tax=Vitis vinifera TaxID=29760 RepID=A0A438CNB9_VITVI|nr:putative disease resistance protein [Vitis vinifera]